MASPTNNPEAYLSAASIGTIGSDGVKQIGSDAAKQRPPLPATDVVAEACGMFIEERAELQSNLQEIVEVQLGHKAFLKLASQVMAGLQPILGGNLRRSSWSKRSVALSRPEVQPDAEVVQAMSELEIPICRASAKPAMLLDAHANNFDVERFGSGSKALPVGAHFSGGTTSLPSRQPTPVSPADPRVASQPAAWLGRQETPNGDSSMNEQAPRHMTASGTDHTAHTVPSSAGLSGMDVISHSQGTYCANFTSSPVRDRSRRNGSSYVSDSDEPGNYSGSAAGDDEPASLTTTAFLLRPSRDQTGSARSLVGLDEAWDYHAVHNVRNRRGSSSARAPVAFKHGSLRGDHNVRSGDVVQGTGSQWMLHPNSALVMLWDFWTLLVVAHDMILAPLVAFVDADLARTSFGSTVEGVSFCTWVLDITMSCCKGYVDGNLGIVELRPRNVLLQYAKTWLLFDLFLVSVDIALWILQSGWTDLLGALRLVRMFRIGRMLRLLKVTVRLSSQRDTTNFLVNNLPSATGTILSVIRNLLIIMMANHFAACGWYAIGQMDTSNQVGPGWIALTPGCEDLMYCYITAYHFTMTQFTPSSIAVDSGNAVERVYEVCCIITGLVVFSAFLGSMTQNLLHYRQLTQTENEQRVHAMRYLNQHKVSVHLAARILAFLRNQSPHYRIMKFSDLQGLENMPVMLQRELQEEVFTPIILRHPLFARMWGTDLSLFNRLCHMAMWEKSIVQGEEAFVPETPAECMYIVMSGMLSYFHTERPFEDEKIEMGSRVAEVSLWACWKHHGRLVGTARSSALALVSARELKRLIQPSPLYKEFAVYARFFITRCNRIFGCDSQVSDLWGNNEDVRPVIAVAFALDRMQGSFKGSSVEKNASGMSHENRVGSAGNTLMAFAEKDEAVWMKTVIMAWSFAAKSQRQGRREGPMNKLRDLAQDVFARRRMPIPRSTYNLISEGLRPLGYSKKKKKPDRKRAMSRELSFSAR